MFLSHLTSNNYILCCLSQISSRTIKNKRASRTNKTITMPITYKKAKSGGVGGMLMYGSDDMLIYTIKGDI